jgi:hypothetical protein
MNLISFGRNAECIRSKVKNGRYAVKMFISIVYKAYFEKISAESIHDVSCVNRGVLTCDYCE